MPISTATWAIGRCWQRATRRRRPSSASGALAWLIGTAPGWSLGTAWRVSGAWTVGPAWLLLQGATARPTARRVMVSSPPSTAGTSGRARARAARTRTRATSSRSACSPTHASMSTSDFPLHQQECGLPALGCKEAFQHRGGEVEGQVAHQHVPITRKPVPQHVVIDDRDVLRCASLQPPDTLRIDLDSGQGPSQTAQRHRESAVTRVDLHDRPARSGNQLLNRVDHRAAPVRRSAQPTAQLAVTNVITRNK